MKKAAIIGIASLVSVGAFAQGTLVFFDNVPGSVVFQVYSPNPANPAVEQTGNTATGQAPAGTTTYGGTAIGGSLFSGTAPATIGVGSPLFADGNLFTAEIYALSTSNQVSLPPFSSLQPVGQYTENFTTSGGTANAYLAGQNLTTDPGIPFTGYDAVNQQIDQKAWLGIAAWYNGGGAYTTLAQAQAAGAPWGISTVVKSSNLGEPSSVETANNGGQITPGTTPPNLPSNIGNGGWSFSLVSTPEPSTIALGVMGFGAFLARRRKH
jgi:hypothetical protein